MGHHLDQEPFDYFYNGGWQTGYYDASSRVFVGSVNGQITTVINNVKPNYISNLQTATPDVGAAGAGEAVEGDAEGGEGALGDIEGAGEGLLNAAEDLLEGL